MASGILARTGKNAQVIVEGVILKKAKWHVDLEGQDIDITNFESAGVDEGATNIVSAAWDLGGLWDAGQNNFDDPPGLFPRDELGEVQFITNITDALLWNFPKNRVISSKNGAEVRQAVTFDSSGKLNGGPFYLPGNIEWESETN